MLHLYSELVRERGAGRGARKKPARRCFELFLAVTRGIWEIRICLRICGTLRGLYRFDWGRMGILDNSIGGFRQSVEIVGTLAVTF